MTHDPHHEHLINELAQQLKTLFSKSPQAIYLYLDDEHKTCNKKFSDMLGYKSVQEWVNNETPLDDVLESDQEKLIHAYIAASQKFKASTFNITLVSKDHKHLDVNLIMVPVTYNNEVFVLHIISQ